jgi:hypothetical protein
MHITTATRSVDYARRDWSSYLAARAEDLCTLPSIEDRRPLGRLLRLLAARRLDSHRQVGRRRSGRMRALPPADRPHTVQERRQYCYVSGEVNLFHRHAERMTTEALADTSVVVVNGAGRSARAPWRN